MFKNNKIEFEKCFGKSIKILELLEKNGYQAYFVGGCVRDFVLEKQFDDIDITTSALPEEVKEVFPKTIDTGLQHGTVTVIYGKEHYEITTFRIEEDYVDHRAPSSVKFVRSLEKDLERRDFTINAMALNSVGELVDLHGGCKDLKLKIVKTVNEANERFYEDALRMLRAFRFSSKLDFNIEEKTLNAIKNNASLIKYVSIERIVAEFRKLFKGSANVRAMNLMIDSGLMKYIPFFSDITEVINLEKYSFCQSLYLLCYLNNIDISLLKKLKLSNKELAKIKNYKTIKSQFDENIDIRKIIYYNDLEDVIFVAQYFNENTKDKLEKISNNLVINNITDIKITIPEIIDLFDKKPGQWIKEVVKNLEHEILLGKIINDKMQIVDFLKTMRDNI